MVEGLRNKKRQQKPHNIWLGPYEPLLFSLWYWFALEECLLCNQSRAKASSLDVSIKLAFSIHVSVNPKMHLCLVWKRIACIICMLWIDSSELSITIDSSYSNNQNMVLGCDSPFIYTSLVKSMSLYLNLGIIGGFFYLFFCITKIVF